MLVWLVEHRMGPVEVSAACAQSPNSSSLRRAKERSVQFQVLPQEAQHLSFFPRRLNISPAGAPFRWEGKNHIYGMDVVLDACPREEKVAGSPPRAEFSFSDWMSSAQ